MGHQMLPTEFFPKRPSLPSKIFASDGGVFKISLFCYG